MSEEVEKLQNTIKEKDEEIQKLQKESDKLKDDIEDLKDKLEQASEQKQHDELKHKKELSDLKFEFEEKLDQRDEKISKLEKERDRLATDATPTPVSNGSNENSEKTKQLEEENASLKQELANKDKEIADLKKTVADLQAAQTSTKSSKKSSALPPAPTSAPPPPPVEPAKKTSSEPTVSNTNDKGGVVTELPEVKKRRSLFEVFGGSSSSEKANKEKKEEEPKISGTKSLGRRLSSKLSDMANFFEKPKSNADPTPQPNKEEVGSLKDRVSAYNQDVASKNTTKADTSETPASPATPNGEGEAPKEDKKIGRRATWNASKFKEESDKLNKCAECGKTVYPTERIATDERVYHKNCLKCSHCGTVLKLGNYASLSGKIYCKPHFKQLFKSKGNYSEGFGEEKPTAKWQASQNQTAQT